jgi:hypothetical protein
VAVRPSPSDAARGLDHRIRALSPIWRRGLLAAVVWSVLVASYAIGFFAAAGGQAGGATFLDGLFLLIAWVLPLVLVALAAWLAEELQRQRAVVAALADLVPPLIGALDGTRDALESHEPVSPQAIRREIEAALLGAGRAGDAAAQLERLLSGQAEQRAALQTLLARSAAPAPPAEPGRRGEPAPAAARPARRAASPPATEPPLPLLPEAEGVARPDWPTLIRALDFPRDAEDREGFRALKAALRHHGLAQMLQAAEDVLTLLAQEGVFVDDLGPEPGDPEAWRRFMAGRRGAEAAGVGAIRDPQALEIARALTKSDPIFRDTALFFQRRFDAVLGEFAAGAGDAAILELADTRSARAFMLLGRLSGSFG